MFGVLFHPFINSHLYIETSFWLIIDLLIGSICLKVVWMRFFYTMRLGGFYDNCIDGFNFK